MTTKQPETPYQHLEMRFKRLSALAEAEAVLHWDMSAIMPLGGAEARAEQLAELKAVQHGLMTGPEMPDLIAAATADEDSLAGWQPANFREMKRRWIKATALSEDLVVALSKACSACETKWRTARPEGDFKAVLPLLEEVLNLTRQAGEAKAEKQGLSLYDALLDDYEPDGRAADIDPVFAALEDFLPDFLWEVLDAQDARPAPVMPEGPFPEATQKALGIQLMEALGFDFDHGRLDISLHPFCGGTPDDVRITTRYDETDFTSSLMGVLHETGHALYERGLPKPWRGQPVGEALGMSMHESQSLLVEMQVCRSQNFLNYAAPLMKAAFGGDSPAWEVDNLHRLYTRVEPGFIRVDADEVTYPAHVILRYRLEKALLEGDMTLADLPIAWNEGMQKMLGLTPASDREGCLQDLHWYDGAWGYFPTYTLGAMTAAQLFDAAKKAKPEIEPGIAKGDFQPLFRWLKANVHGKGSLLTAKELLIEATGKPLDPEVFKSHLKTRYLG
ncbi:MAG: carboxypeptidase M32 [Rhodospirillales bacterium]|nr:carboxypeptidase M32 [Alphaproteobacteria bacterium]MBL6947683.1 carboxypeptidase M32 [Rhodospirillales bacterium]